MPDETVQQLRDFYNEDPTGILLAPYPKLGDKIALGAWTVPDDFQPGDTTASPTSPPAPPSTKDAFSTFRDELRFRGPERLPAGLVRAPATPSHPPGWRNWQTRPT